MKPLSKLQGIHNRSVPRHLWSANNFEKKVFQLVAAFTRFLTALDCFQISPKIWKKYIAKLATTKKQYSINLRKPMAITPEMLRKFIENVSTWPIKAPLIFLFIYFLLLVMFRAAWDLKLVPILWKMKNRNNFQFIFFTVKFRFSV